jgi:Kef-type K+ transport system membrane component KefB
MAAAVGLLLTGILVGPNGFGLIDVSEQSEILGEIGVVLLFSPLQ